MTSMTVARDQFYLFTMPGDMCPVWSEVWLADGTHMVAPTPHATVEDATAYLTAANPGATVDELDLAADIAECRQWARTRPYALVRPMRNARPAVARSTDGGSAKISASVSGSTIFLTSGIQRLC